MTIVFGVSAAHIEACGGFELMVLLGGKVALSCTLSANIFHKCKLGPEYNL